MSYPLCSYNNSCCLSLWRRFFDSFTIFKLAILSFSSIRSATYCFKRASCLLISSRYGSISYKSTLSLTYATPIYTSEFWLYLTYDYPKFYFMIISLAAEVDFFLRSMISLFILNCGGLGRTNWCFLISYTSHETLSWGCNSIIFCGYVGTYGERERLDINLFVLSFLNFSL